MRHLQVSDSDIIKSVAYDTEREELKVVFKATPDVVYSYGATEHEFVSFVTADSIGSFFHKNFKKRAFTKSQLEPDLKK